VIGVGAITLWALRALPETLPEERRSSESIVSAMANYGQLLRSRRIMSYAGAGGFFYGGMFAYIAGTPAAYISYYHVSPQFYGGLFALGIFGIMISNHLNARWVARHGIDRLLRCGAAGAAISGAVLAIMTRIGLGGLIGLVIPLLMFVSATGFIVANSIVGALGSHPERAGAVSALVGTIQYGTGIFGSALVGFFADGSPWPMGWIIAVFGAGSLICAVFFVSSTEAGAGAH
jgi:DHA1 family bicyclomycin/chloramphenicol resistance-like MFS transporter